MDIPDTYEIDQDTINDIELWRQEDQAQLAALPTTRQSRTQDCTCNHDDYYEDESDLPQVFKISSGLVNGCAAEDCSKTSNLNCCAACKVVCYCGSDLQAASRPSHRSRCKKIKKALSHLGKKEHDLIRTGGDDVFEKEKGRFWDIPDTRNYMIARLGLVEELLKVNTRQAQASALDHLLGMMQLSRSDNLGARNVVPALYLRLGREQEFYDFSMWWITTGHDVNYDLRNMPLPFLDINGTDVFDDVKPFMADRCDLSHMVSTTLLKIRLMVDVQAIQRASEEAGPHVPQEVLDEIMKKAMRCSISNKAKMLKCDDYPALIAVLKDQIQGLHAEIEKRNKYFWPALLNPSKDLNFQPLAYGRGDENEMRLILRYSYISWMETPGAIDVIKALERK